MKKQSLIKRFVLFIAHILQAVLRIAIFAIKFILQVLKVWVLSLIFEPTLAPDTNGFWDDLDDDYFWGWWDY